MIFSTVGDLMPASNEELSDEKTTKTVEVCVGSDAGPSPHTIAVPRLPVMSREWPGPRPVAHTRPHHCHLTRASAVVSRGLVSGLSPGSRFSHQWHRVGADHSRHDRFHPVDRDRAWRDVLRSEGCHIRQLAQEVAVAYRENPAPSTRQAPYLSLLPHLAPLRTASSSTIRQDLCPLARMCPDPALRPPPLPTTTPSNSHPSPPCEFSCSSSGTQFNIMRCTQSNIRCVSRLYHLASRDMARFPLHLAVS